MKRAALLLILASLSCAALGAGAPSIQRHPAPVTSGRSERAARSIAAPDSRFVDGPGDLQARVIVALNQTQARLRTTPPSWGARLASLQIHGMQSHREVHRRLDLDMLCRAFSGGVTSVQRARANQG